MTTATEPTTTDERFTLYDLSKLVSGTFTLDSYAGTLTLLRGGSIAENQLLTPSEFSVVQAIFENYPDYAPREVLLSAVTGKSLKKCRERLNWGIENKVVESVMSPVRNLLNRLRGKLYPFGLDIRSIAHTGYMLVPPKIGDV